MTCAIDEAFQAHRLRDHVARVQLLRGEQIPLAARLFAIIDVWDALRSDRPYRKAWPEAKVLEHIQNLSGTHFDARVVAAFMPLVTGT